MSKSTRANRVMRRWFKPVTALVVTMAATTLSIVAIAPASHAITPGITGYRVVTPGPVSFGALGPVAQTVSVSCPAGQSVVGGGVDSHSPQAYISSSYPSAADTWTIREKLTVDVGYIESFTPYAVCVDTSSVPGINIAIQGTPITLSASSGTITGVQCPSGDEATDGGLLSRALPSR